MHRRTGEVVNRVSWWEPYAMTRRRAAQGLWNLEFHSSFWAVVFAVFYALGCCAVLAWLVQPGAAHLTSGQITWVVIGAIVLFVIGLCGSQFAPVRIGVSSKGLSCFGMRLKARKLNAAAVRESDGVRSLWVGWHTKSGHLRVAEFGIGELVDIDSLESVLQGMRERMMPDPAPDSLLDVLVSAESSDDALSSTWRKGAIERTRLWICREVGNEILYPTRFRPKRGAGWDFRAEIEIRDLSRVSIVLKYEVGVVCPRVFVRRRWFWIFGWSRLVGSDSLDLLLRQCMSVRQAERDVSPEKYWEHEFQRWAHEQYLQVMMMGACWMAKGDRAE